MTAVIGVWAVENDAVESADRSEANICVTRPPLPSSSCEAFTSETSLPVPVSAP